MMKKSQNMSRKYKVYIYMYTLISLFLLVCLFLLTNKFIFEILGIPNILETFAVVNGLHMFMTVAFIVILLLILFILVTAISIMNKRLNKIKNK